MRIRLSSSLAVLTLLFGTAAHAAEPEKVVVKNRLHVPEGKVELGAQVGQALINRLTDHTNFQARGAYNFTNEWAAELMGGYAYSRHTSIANQVTSEVASKKVDTTPVVDDFPSLWEMKWNVVAGARWAPIYGKLNLVAELPVHFQAYVGAGAGVGGLSRTSVTYCLQDASKDAAGNVTCAEPLTETRVSPLIHFGGGLRFFVGRSVALNIEARDYTFPDKYQAEIDRKAAISGNAEAGKYIQSPGFQNVVFVTAGLSYLF